MAFPPPPVTFPATRPKVPKDLKRRSSHWLIISSGCCSFLSGQLRSTLRLILASLSASAPGVPDSGFPLLLSSNGVSPPPFHLPMPVKIPVSNFDCEAILHSQKSMSSRKYFNYRPYFTGVLWKNCGKPVEEIVEGNVENGPSILAP